MLNFVDNHMNYTEYRLLTSSNYTSKIIKLLKEEINKGKNPNEILDEVLDYIGCSIDDILPSDQNKIDAEISEYWKQYERKQNF